MNYLSSGFRIEHVIARMKNRHYLSAYNLLNDMGYDDVDLKHLALLYKNNAENTGSLVMDEKILSSYVECKLTEDRLPLLLLIAFAIYRFLL